MSKDSNAKIFSVIGGCRRSGRWLVPAKTEMMTFFGRAVIDLRQAQTSAEELEFTCTSAFANITFIVPEGAEVRPSGMAVLGSSKCIVPVTSTPCHLPPISVDATTILGRLRVRTTDRDPDDNQGRRWFRRKKSAMPPAGAVSAPSAEATEPVGVEPRGFSSPSTTPASPATTNAAFAADNTPTANAAFTPNNPPTTNAAFAADNTPTANPAFTPNNPPTANPAFTPNNPPTANPAFTAENPPAPGPEMPDTQTISPPIPAPAETELAATPVEEPASEDDPDPEADDERSPLENVEVPESLEGTVAEAETPSTT